MLRRIDRGGVKNALNQAHASAVTPTRRAFARAACGGFGVLCYEGGWGCFGGVGMSAFGLGFVVGGFVVGVARGLLLSCLGLRRRRHADDSQDD